MAPTQTDVHKDELLKWATTWEEQSSTVGGISSEIGGMKITVDGGNAFHEAVVLYNQVAGQVETWTGQGKTVMLNITTELCRAARNYGATEEEIIRATHGAVR